MRKSLCSDAFRDFLGGGRERWRTSRSKTSASVNKKKPCQISTGVGLLRIGVVLCQKKQILPSWGHTLPSSSFWRQPASQPACSDWEGPYHVGRWMKEALKAGWDYPPSRNYWTTNMSIEGFWFEFFPKKLCSQVGMGFISLICMIYLFMGQVWKVFEGFSSLQSMWLWAEDPCFLLCSGPDATHLMAAMLPIISPFLLSYRELSWDTEISGQKHRHCG